VLKFSYEALNSFKALVGTPQIALVSYCFMTPIQSLVYILACVFDKGQQTDVFMQALAKLLVHGMNR